jgi:hypothetical protein
VPGVAPGILLPLLITWYRMKTRPSKIMHMHDLQIW